MHLKKIAIVHDYFYTFGGAEKTVEAWLQLYPDAVIYTNFITLVNFRGTIFERLYHSGQLKVTAEQRLLSRSSPTLFKMLFWLHPILAWFGIKVPTDVDLILISSVYSAKYARLPEVKTIHYCHSPTRFLYADKMRTELNHERFPWYIKYLTTPTKHLLRKWDQFVVNKLKNNHTTWLTNSSYNQSLIEQIYGIKTQVVFPPVDIKRFAATVRVSSELQSGYIMYGRVVPIKHVERAILACTMVDQPLTVIGEYSANYKKQLEHLLDTTRKQTLITFTGNIDDAAKMKLFSSAKAMIFPALEDFGIAPVEVMAAGIPIIALKGAGALEYIKEGVNGVFFEGDKDEQTTVHNLINTLVDLNPHDFDSRSICKSVQYFEGLHTSQLTTVIGE